MDEFERKCKIVSNEALGRHVIAASDIKAGETISLECPVIILPGNNEQRCANCLNLTKSFCRRCKVFSLCEQCTQHNEFDCKFITSSQFHQVEDLQKNGTITGILKCLLLKENPETEQYFETLLQLEAHLEERRNTDPWKEYQEAAVAPIISSGLPASFKRIGKKIDEDFLQLLCGIIDVNCFEIRAPDTGSMRSIYLRGALLAHSCMANTVIAIDNQYRMKIYANCDIAQGGMVYNCYANVLLGTDERREHLRIGKYFHCCCIRCEDPTELGSHMSSLICGPCLNSGNSDEGVLIKKGDRWQCLNCAHSLSKTQVNNILDRVKEEIFHSRGDIYRYEILLSKLGRILHQNHYLMLDLKQNIAAILRSIILNLAHRPGQKVYERKVNLCREIVKVLKIIQPGISRLRAIALYELCNSAAELSRLRFGEGTITESELLQELQEAESMLRESTRMLLHEPVNTPEGELTRSMLKELKDLQNDIGLLQQKQIDE